MIDDSLYDEAERILTDAAAIIEERGWCQNHLRDEQGRVCALGAIREAQSGDAGYVCTNSHATRARHLATVLLADATGEHTYVDDWNDRPGRSLEDVQLAFKHAADAAHHHTPPSGDAMYRYLNGSTYSGADGLV